MHGPAVIEKQRFLHDHQPEPYDGRMWDLNRLRMWRAVVSTESVTEAARNLQYSPASVSQQIIALQQAVGFPLYRRVGRGIEITEAGRRFADETDVLFRESARLTDVVDSLRSGPRGRVSIGCSSSVAREWIPGVLRDAVARFPDLSYDVMTNEPFTGLERQRADVDVASEPGHTEETARGGFSRDHLLDDAYLLILPADHTLSEHSEVSVGQLADEPLLDPDVQGSATGDVIDHAARAAGISPRYAARADDHYGILAMVAAGIGLAALPRLAVAELPADLTSRPLTDPTPYRRIVLHVDRRVAHLPHIEFLRDAFIRTAAATPRT